MSAVIVNPGITMQEWLEKYLSEGRTDEVIPMVRMLSAAKWEQYLPILESWVSLALSSGKDREVIKFMTQMSENRREPFRKIWVHMRPKGGAA